MGADGHKQDDGDGDGDGDGARATSRTLQLYKYAGVPFFFVQVQERDERPAHDN